MSWQDDLERLIDAVEVAEGGRLALVRAVRCSVHCEDYAEARQITKNSIIHRLWDFAMLEHPEIFVRFMGARWAPVGDGGNDPRNLNANWVGNVLGAWNRKA